MLGGRLFSFAPVKLILNLFPIPDQNQLCVKPLATTCVEGINSRFMFPELNLHFDPPCWWAFM